MCLFVEFYSIGLSIHRILRRLAEGFLEGRMRTDGAEEAAGGQVVGDGQGQLADQVRRSLAHERRAEEDARLCVRHHLDEPSLPFCDLRAAVAANQGLAYAHRDAAQSNASHSILKMLNFSVY